MGNSRTKNTYVRGKCCTQIQMYFREKLYYSVLRIIIWIRAATPPPTIIIICNKASSLSSTSSSSILFNFTRPIVCTGKWKKNSTGHTQYQHHHQPTALIENFSQKEKSSMLCYMADAMENTIYYPYSVLSLQLHKNLHLFLVLLFRFPEMKI